MTIAMLMRNTVHVGGRFIRGELTPGCMDGGLRCVLLTTAGRCACYALLIQSLPRRPVVVQPETRLLSLQRWATGLLGAAVAGMVLQRLAGLLERKK